MQKLKNAVERNNFKAVKRYIEIYDPSYDYNWAIRYASANGYTKIVKLLLSDSRVNPRVESNQAIRYASEYGHLDIVCLLLSDPQVDPSDLSNYAISSASENGYLEIVRLLLSDPRVDPSANHNWAIRVASKNGYVEVVKLLIQDYRVDFNAIDDEEMKKLLLKEEINKLRQEFSFRYQVIQKSSPQILIEGKQKSKIPSALIRKIIYDASHQERSTSIRLLALEKLIIQN